MKKPLEIVKEEFKNAGVEIAEEVLEKAVGALFEKVLPRLVTESDNAAIKSVSGVVLMLYPTLKPAISKATDLNHDGK